MVVRPWARSRAPASIPTATALGSARSQSAWAAAVSAAQSIVSPPPAPPSSPSSGPSSSPSSSSKGKSPAGSSPFDAIPLVSSDLDHLRGNIMSLLGSGHPSLDSVAKYYFQAEGKHIRPLIVLLMSAATNGVSPIFAQGPHAGREERDLTGVDDPLSPKSVLNDYNPSMLSGADGNAAASSSTSTSSAILPTQRRLAEIAEMIHVASLLHDDVIDESSLRRGAPSSPSTFGNKLSILGGDFLLGRASVSLARLRDNEVVELLATVIANLVEGEVMQMKGVDASVLEGSGLASFWSGEKEQIAGGIDGAGPTPAHFTSYLQKTYLKTASLMAKSARAATILGGCGEGALQQWLALRSQSASPSREEDEALAARCGAVRDAAYGYGRNLGIAFQLVDDLLDFRSTSAAFGKPSLGADLRLGLATAPVLYAWQEFSGKEHGLGEMVERKFEGPGDVERALELVHESRGLERTAELARHHGEMALKCLEVVEEGEAKAALVRLVQGVLERVK
ncbi:terpenoid synthase [Jaminaea rosea]|uniref:(2E,6E)-farnesyl diphosphate synthase n=1 Tax=Jaminaea rosea TaxID=1569628 RepID=A0A316UYV0_9BASI|nr:terpenoid synthase [Jaminaea rosea]PWN30469.1 terpenoid synthase [Jaminaea rosea]